MIQMMKSSMNELIAELRAVMPKRPLTYGVLLHVTRMQAWKLRQRIASHEPAINLIWLRDQQAVPVNQVPSYQLGGQSGLTTDAITGNLEIYINANEPHMRQRFTLLHEFKHVIDFFGVETVYARLGSGNLKRQTTQIEALANEFAGCVLMPGVLMRQAWRDSQDIDALSRVFRVSAEAVTTRLEKLGFIANPRPQPRTFFRSAGTVTSTDAELVLGALAAA